MNEGPEPLLEIAGGSGSNFIPQLRDKIWWRRVDLNHRHAGYEPTALIRLSYAAKFSTRIFLDENLILFCKLFRVAKQDLSSVPKSPIILPHLAKKASQIQRDVKPNTKRRLPLCKFSYNKVNVSKDRFPIGSKTGSASAR